MLRTNMTPMRNAFSPAAVEWCDVMRGWCSTDERTGNGGWLAIGAVAPSPLLLMES